MNRWAGATVAILASGPSMSKAVCDSVRAAGLLSIATNDTYRLAPWADVLYAADSAWWRAQPEAHAFAGEKLCGEKVNGLQFVVPQYVTRGGNSALRAAHWAMSRGVSCIALCGVDLDRERLTHWHGVHVGLRNPVEEDFDHAIEAWTAFADCIERPAVVNCSPSSALKCFPFVDLDRL